MEIWKKIENYEGYYEISNYGRVRSLDRLIFFKNNQGSRFYKGKILKQKYHNGYAYVNLNKNKNMEVIAVHILVAKHFLSNPKKLPCVNHKDGVKSNNHVTNLEWVTYAENNYQALINNLKTNNIQGLLTSKKEKRIAIVCYENNQIIQVSNCSRELANWLIKNNKTKTKNIETLSRIIRKYSKENKKYYNFKFERIELKKELLENQKKILILKDNKVLEIFETTKKCAEWLLEKKYLIEVNRSTIARHIRKIKNTKKTYHNFQFQELF